VDVHIEVYIEVVDEDFWAVADFLNFLNFL